jgi:hypothetical protein
LNQFKASGVIVGRPEVRKVNVCQSLYTFNLLIDGSRAGTLILCTYIPQEDALPDLNEGCRLIVAGWLGMRKDVGIFCAVRELFVEAPR